MSEETEVTTLTTAPSIVPAPNCPCPLCQWLSATTTPSAIDAKGLAEKIATHLLTGSNLGGLPDDMGVDPRYRMGTALQNFMEWPARLGTIEALLDANTLIKLIAMLDALVASKGKTTQEQLLAANAALTSAEQALAAVK